MRPERRGVNLAFLPARAEIRRQPLGVVGIVAPWNYPIQLALIPLADAIAAGNHVLVKPSEHTPRTSALLARLLAEAFPSERVTVVQGDAAVGAAFTRLPFDHLVFTGSTAVGRAVMAAAAAMSCRLTHSRWLWTSCMPVKIFGVGRPRAVRREPSVPPRMGTEVGSMPRLRAAVRARLTGVMSFSSQ